MAKATKVTVRRLGGLSLFTFHNQSKNGEPSDEVGLVSCLEGNMAKHGDSFLKLLLENIWNIYACFEPIKGQTIWVFLPRLFYSEQCTTKIFWSNHKCVSNVLIFPALHFPTRHNFSLRGLVAAGQWCPVHPTRLDACRGPVGGRTGRDAAADPAGPRNWRGKEIEKWNKRRSPRSRRGFILI